MILKMERRAIDLFDRNYKLVCFLFLLGLSMLIRYYGRNYISLDAEIFLLPWRDEIINNGGLLALGNQVGNYNMLYQAIIAVLSYLPIKGIYTYKMVSMVFDYLLGIAVASIVNEVAEKNQKNCAATGFFLTVFSPIVIMNSSIWAQCDAIYTFFGICAVWMLIRDRFCYAFVLWGIAFAFKLQAIFLLPIFAITYLIKKRFSIFYFGIIPIVMLLLSLPNVLFFGRSVRDIFSIYGSQITESTAINYNYPSAILILTTANISGVRYEVFKHSAFTMVFALLVGMFFFMKKKNITLTSVNIIYITFLSVYMCVLFLPCMHERYGYVYEILAIIILVLNRKTILPFITLILLSCATYSNFLFGMEIPIGNVAAYVNLVAFLAYSLILWSEMIHNEPSNEKDNTLTKNM